MQTTIKLKSNERVLITGKTGSGKTYLARYLTRAVRRLVVLDAKGTLKSWGLEDYTTAARSKIVSGEPVRVRILPPFGGDPLEFWDEALSVVYAAGNCTVYIDELYAVCPPNLRPSNVLWSLYTRGRELGVGIWASTQRPVWVPLFALSEAEHFFMFRLQLDEDRKRMAAFMSPVVIRSIRDEHGFFYSLAGMDEPEYITRLEAEEDNIKPVNATIKLPEKQKSRLRTFLNLGG